MKRLLSVLFLFFFGLTMVQSQVIIPNGWRRNIGGGGTLVLYSTNSTTTTTGVNSFVLTGLPAGCRIVVATAYETAGGNCTVTNTVASALTWTKRGDASAATSGDAEIHDATFTAGGSITVTATWGGTGYTGTAVFVFTGQETTPAGAVQTATFQSAPSVGITTTRTFSTIICVSSDYTATDGTVRTIRDGSEASSGGYFRSAGNATFYFYLKNAATASAYTMGYSIPLTMQAGTVAYEVRQP